MRAAGLLTLYMVSLIGLVNRVLVSVVLGGELVMLNIAWQPKVGCGCFW